MGAKTTLDRDISWMYFNHRILQEAQRDNVPLLERLKFLGIYSNNLDEFFRVRVSTMKRIVEYDNEPQNRPASTIRELREITRLTKDYSQEFDETFENLKGKLASEGIFIVNEQQLTDEQQRYIRTVYRTDLNSATYPLIMTQGSKLLMNWMFQRRTRQNFSAAASPFSRQRKKIPWKSSPGLLVMMQ